MMRLESGVREAERRMGWGMYSWPQAYSRTMRLNQGGEVDRLAAAAIHTYRGLKARGKQVYGLFFYIQHNDYLGFRIYG